MIGRRSAILDEADRWLFPVILLVSVFVTFRGHNAPGGGFAGGLIAGCGFVLRFLAGGTLTARRSVIARPASLTGIGMLIAVGTALSPLMFGDALLESTIWEPELPLIGVVKIVSSAIFDLGVYFLVIGVVLSVLVALGADPIHHSDHVLADDGSADDGSVDDGSVDDAAAADRTSSAGQAANATHDRGAAT